MSSNYFKIPSGTKIILASGSPRRQQILREMGVDFTVVLKEVSEDFPSDLENAQVAEYLAYKKAAAYDDEVAAGNIVITADTIVCVDQHILNKPADREDAFRMLKLLSGRSHDVVTAVCMRLKEKNIFFHVTTEVTFKDFNNEEIYWYIDNYKPYDKAGSYGIQEWIGLIGVEKIVGSYQNIIGLPSKEVYEQLQNFLAN